MGLAMAEESGPNLGVRGKPPKGITRQELEKIPQVVLDELQRRVDEVTFAKEVFNKQWDGSSLNAAIKEYEGRIDRNRVKLIYNDPAKYVKQTGLGANPAILNQIDLASPAGFKKYVTKSLNDVKAAVNRLNKHLYPGGMTKKDILRSIHFAHGQGLASGGAHFGGSYMLDSGPKNVRENRWSGITKGKYDTKTKQFVVGDAYSAIGHPQFWDDAMTNYILGKDAPLLVELSDEAKQKIIHQGYDADRIIIEQDNINLNRIDDDVAEYIPFKRKGPPPKGEILTINGRKPSIATPTPDVTEIGRPLRGVGNRLRIARQLNNLPVVGELGAAGIIAGPSLLAGKPVQAMEDLWQNLPDVTPVLGDVLDATTAENTSPGTWDFERNMPTDHVMYEQSLKARKDRTDLVTSTAVANIPQYDFSGVQKLVTNPLNEIKWGYKQLLDLTKTFQ